MSETQNVESTNTSQREIASKNSFAETSTEKVDVPETSAPEATTNEPEIKSQEPIEAAPEGNEGELPEFAKRRLGKEQKKYEREISRLKAQLDEARATTARPQANSYGYAPNSSVYEDPLMPGNMVDANTPEGQAILSYHQRLSQHMNAQDRVTQQREQQEVEAKLFAHFQDSFEDAKEKYSDFDKTIQSAGMRETLGREMAQFPDPGELAYYLASNPREVERIQRLPAYEMRRELARHMADMTRKNNVTQAPVPIKPIASGAASPIKHFAHKTIAELKAERRAQLSGKGRR